MDDSAITCDEFIDAEAQSNDEKPNKFECKNITCKMQNFYILLAFLLITIALLISVSIYLIKYRAKETFFTVSRHK